MKALITANLKSIWKATECHMTQLKVKTKYGNAEA